MKKMVFGTILTIVAIFLAFNLVKDIDFYEVYLIFTEINFVYVSLAFVSGLFAFLLWNLRFRNSLRGLVKIKYLSLLPILFTGLFVNMITPGSGVGGEPVRAYYLSKKYKKPKTKFLGCIFGDKFFNLAVFISFVIISLLLVIIYFDIQATTKFILEGVLLLLFVIVASFVYFFFRKYRLDITLITKNLYKLRILKKRFQSYARFNNYVNKKLDNFLTIFRKVIVDKKRFYSGIFLSILIWMFTFLISYFLFLAFGFHVNFISVITVVTLGFFFGDISPLPGGIGMAEGVMFLLYSAMGIFEPVAIAVALLSRIIYYFYTLLIGGIALIYVRNMY